MTRGGGGGERERERERERETDRQTDRQTDRHTDTQADRQTETRQRERQRQRNRREILWKRVSQKYKKEIATDSHRERLINYVLKIFFF